MSVRPNGAQWPEEDDVRSAKRARNFKMRLIDLTEVLECHDMGEYTPTKPGEVIKGATAPQVILHILEEFKKLDEPEGVIQITCIQDTPHSPLLALSCAFVDLFCCDTSRDTSEFSYRTSSQGWYGLIRTCERIAKEIREGYYHDVAVKILNIINTSIANSPHFKGRRICEQYRDFITHKLEARQEVALPIVEQFVREFPNETWLLESMRREIDETKKEDDDDETDDETGFVNEESDEEDEDAEDDDEKSDAEDEDE